MNSEQAAGQRKQIVINQWARRAKRSDWPVAWSWSIASIVICFFNCAYWLVALIIVSPSALCVFQALDLLAFLSFSFLIGQMFMALTYKVILVKTCLLCLHASSLPSVPTEVVVLSCCLGSHVSDFRGEPVSIFLSLVIFLWLVILLFIDVNDVCYHLHNVPWFWFRHVGILAWLLSGCRHGIGVHCTCIQISSLYVAK